MVVHFNYTEGKMYNSVVPLSVFVSMALIWTVNDYFYIAGSLNVENLAGNMFLNFSLLSLTELPSVFIGQFLIGLLLKKHKKKMLIVD